MADYGYSLRGIKGTVHLTDREIRVLLSSAMQTLHRNQDQSGLSITERDLKAKITQFRDMHKGQVL